MPTNKLREIGKILFYNRFMNYSKISMIKFVKAAAVLVEKNKKILDAGAGECQYESYFKHANYVSQDLGVGDETWDFSQIDIKSEIYDIPVENQSFDYILCMEVMEHLKYPQKAFKEFSRILRLGGLLFVVCPLMWGEHQTPHDYFRYTQFALKMLADENGFKVREMKPMGGRFLVFSELINEIYYINLSAIDERFGRTISYAVQMLLYPLMFVISFLLYYIDKTDKKKNVTMQYECIFVKS